MQYCQIVAQLHRITAPENWRLGFYSQSPNINQGVYLAYPCLFSMVYIDFKVFHWSRGGTRRQPFPYSLRSFKLGMAMLFRRTSARSCRVGQFAPDPDSIALMDEVSAKDGHCSGCVRRLISPFSNVYLSDYPELFPSLPQISMMRQSQRSTETRVLDIRLSEKSPQNSFIATSTGLSSALQRYESRPLILPHRA